MDRWFKSIINDIQGSIYYGTRVYSKKSLLEHAYDWVEAYGECKTAILQIGTHVDYWPCFFAGVISKKRLVLLDVRTSKEETERIAQESNADMIFIVEDGTIVTKTYEKKRSDTDKIEENQLENKKSYVVEPSKDECEIVLFTTGTTGKPKGVIIPWSKFLKNQSCINDGKFEINSKDTTAHLLNVAHSMGLAFGTLAFLTGGDFYVCDNTTSFYRKIVSGTISAAMIPPTLFYTLFKDDLFKKAAEKMKFIATGGGLLKKNVYDEAVQRQVHIINGYGMTECVSGIASGDAEHIYEDLAVVPLDGLTIILSEEDEILVKGATVCESYLDGTRITDKEGWYHTGDRGMWVGDRIFVKGRMDNVIILESGYKVDLDELEQRVCSVPGVFDARTFYRNGILGVEVVEEEGETVNQELIKRQFKFYEEVKILIVEQLTLKGSKKNHK